MRATCGPTADEVPRAHARREQRLVRVAEGRLGDRERRLLAQRAGEPGRAELEQALERARPAARAERSMAGQLAAAARSRAGFSPYGRLTVMSTSQLSSLVRAVARLVAREQLAGARR